MRIQGIWKIIKNKHELGLIIVIISISFSILSAVSIVNDTYQMQIFTELMDESIVDFRVTLDSRLDPSEDFHQFLNNYQGWLSVEEEYKTQVISIKNAIVSLNYQSVSENISHQWDFLNSYFDIFFVGIDELTFNVLKNKSDIPIVNMNMSYQQLENGFAVANFLKDYENIFPELNLAISTNASSYDDQDLPMKVDLFNEMAKSSIDLLPNLMTKPNANLSLSSTFQILNEKQFYSLIGIDEWKLSAPIFICGEKLMNQFVDMDDLEISQIGKVISLNLKFDRTPILKKSPGTFLRELDKFRSASNNWNGDFWHLQINWGVWYSKLNDLANNGAQFQFYSIIIFIPIFILCGKYLRTSFRYLIEKRRNEFGLYLINGMSFKTIKRIIFGTGFLIGAIGGLFGTILGLFLSKYVGNILFPTTTTFSSYIFTETWSILLQNGIVNLIAGGFFAVLSLKKPLKTINNQELQINLIKNPLLIKKEQTNNKIRNILLILFLSSLLLALFYDLTFETVDFNILSDDYPALFWVLSLSGPLMGLFPFVFPTLLVALVADKLGDWIEAFQRKRFEEKNLQKLKTSLQKTNSFDKKKSKPASYLKKLTTWSLIHKLNKNKNLLEIYTLAIIFISISVNIGSAYEYSEGVHSTLYHANGEMMNLDFFDDINIGEISQFTQQMQEDALKLDFNHMNTVCHTQINKERYIDEEIEWDIKLNSLNVSQMWYYCFSWVNYSLLKQDTSMLDEWMIGGSVNEIFEKMHQPNSILIPSYLLDEGVKINDTLSFTLESINGTKIQKNGIVVGAYVKFPASYMERNYDENVDYEIYMSFDLLQDARMEMVEFIYYLNSNLSNLQKSQISQYITDNFEADFSLRFLDIQRYHNDYDSKTFELFQIEGYLLVLFALFGFLIYFLIGNLQSNAELAVLRSKGLLEKDLIRSSIYETLILVGIGSVLSLISTIGSKGLILFLNLQRTGSGDDLFYLYFQMNWLWFVLISLLGGILFFLISLGFNFLQIKGTRSDQKLEELMRSSN